MGNVMEMYWLIEIKVHGGKPVRGERQYKKNIKNW